VSGLTGVTADLQEISRGIHPAILSKGGLGPALKTVARRSAIPVTLDLTIDQRLQDSVEVGAYYVVSEALTNAAKHSRANHVVVSGQTKDRTLSLSIHDDGIGGQRLRARRARRPGRGPRRADAHQEPSRKGDVAGGHDSTRRHMSPECGARRRTPPGSRDTASIGVSARASRASQGLNSIVSKGLSNWADQWKSFLAVPRSTLRIRT
jgi:hypothetical protein